MQTMPMPYIVRLPMMSDRKPNSGTQTSPMGRGYQHVVEQIALLELELLGAVGARSAGWCGDADRGVGRQQPDQQGRDAHQKQGGDERELASDAVAEVAEDGRADGPGREADELHPNESRMPVNGDWFGKNSAGKIRAAAVP
jgi:hypothetical protein